MRKAFLLSLLIALSSLPGLTQSQANSSHDLSGRWMMTTEIFGTPVYYRLNLTQQGNKLTGDFGGDKLEGTVDGNTMQFHAVDQEGGYEDCKATISNGTLSGTVIFVDASDKDHPQTRSFTASQKALDGGLLIGREVFGFMNHGCPRLIIVQCTSTHTNPRHCGRPMRARSLETGGRSSSFREKLFSRLSWRSWHWTSLNKTPDA